MGLTRLIVRVGHYQHRLARPHGLSCRANTALVDDSGGPREQLREGGVLDRNNSFI